MTGGRLPTIALSHHAKLRSPTTVNYSPPHHYRVHCKLTAILFGFALSLDAISATSMPIPLVAIPSCPTPTHYRDSHSILNIPATFTTSTRLEDNKAPDFILGRPLNVPSGLLKTNRMPVPTPLPGPADHALWGAPEMVHHFGWQQAACCRDVDGAADPCHQTGRPPDPEPWPTKAGTGPMLLSNITARQDVLQPH